MALRGFMTWPRSPREKVAELGSDLVAIRLFAWLSPTQTDV